jgi:branched-chain amino acid transport system substrate-binding protein
MRRKILAATALSALLAVVGCSSSSSSSSSASGTSAAGTSSTPAGAPIVIGTVGGYSGDQAGSQGIANQANQVWADSVNGSGGINGHPVKLIVLDDANDPARAFQDVKELVEQDHVMAIVGENSLVDSQWAPWVEKQGVPVIGGVPIQTTMFANPDFFPTGSNVVAMIMGELVSMKAAGLHTFGLMYCAESPICATLPGLVQASATVVGGVKIGPSAKIAATQPSFTAECLTMKQAGVDGLMVGENAPTVPRVMDACATLGYTPKQVNQGTSTNNQWLTSANLEGAVLTSPSPVYNDSSIPAVKQYLDAIQKYDPSMLTSPEFDVNDIWSWTGGMMFKKAAEAADIGPNSTPADVKKGLYTIKDETLGGLTPPITYTAGKPTFVSCYFTMTIKSGKYVPLNDGNVTCLTPAQLSGLKKILGL